MNIFISHASKDAAVAERVCNLIEERGKKCFIAPRDIRSGREYAEEIINGIDNAESMILLMSDAANHSPHVLREVERAVSKAIPILVYKLEEVELTKSMEYFLMSHQWSNTKQKGDYSEILQFVYATEEETKERLLPKDVDEKPIEVIQESAQKGENKKNRKWTIIAEVLIITVLILLVAVICMNNRRGQQNQNPDNPVVTIEAELGDTITFGNYNGEPIDWRVLHISEDGTEAILIAEHILTMKAYDAAEGGTYNSDGKSDYWQANSAADTDYELQVLVRGNNLWSASNIRTWLNSADEVVTYEDRAPVPLAMSEHKNGYHNESGFLYGFTDAELDALLEREVVTNANILYDAATVTTRDKVFLLSKEELQWFEEAGMRIYASPTQAAIEQDTSNWYDIDVTEYEITEYYWWLREPVEGTTSKCYLVSNGYTQEVFYTSNAGVEGFGIRPAITVDLTAEIFQEEE